MVMNSLFKPDILQPILARVGVSISDLKRNPAAVITAAKEQQVAILNRNRPVAYMISPEVWEGILDLMEEQEDAKLVSERLADMDNAIPVKLDDIV